MGYRDSSIWQKMVHQTALRKTVIKMNEHPDVKISQSIVMQVLKGVKLYIQATSMSMTLPEHHKERGAKEFIGKFGNLAPFYYVTLHHMYLNKEFTQREWIYIRDTLYKKQFINYFKYYDNKGKYIGQSTYQREKAFKISGK